jgi:hypothetical protein
MTRKANIVKYLSLALVFIAVALVGEAMNAEAQRDPFRKPGYQTPRLQGVGSIPGRNGSVTLTPGVPSIEQRIDYFKRLREQAAASGNSLPKVTSVLTLDEMSVTGIFKTPRGYAAMVEATPIKLTYTIYPGEKFFDGQLVAVEENRLVFRKVTKTEKGKFVSAVENKPLRKFSVREEIEGTALVDTNQRSTETVSSTQPVQNAAGDSKVSPAKIVSPLDEMNKQVSPEPSEKEKTAKGVKKPVKVARNKN